MIEKRKTGPVMQFYFERWKGSEIKKWWSIDELANEPECKKLGIDSAILRERLKRANRKGSTMDTVFKCMTRPIQNTGFRCGNRKFDTSERDQWLDMMGFMVIGGHHE